MTSHYFSERPISSGKEKIITTTLFNHHFTFKSQSGIFSWKEIDAGSRLLLDSMILPEKEDAVILDLGCGYGLIGIAIAKTNPKKKVFLSDINELAVKMTKENCKSNGVEKNTQVFQGNLFEPFEKELLFDLIITNPPILAGKKTLLSIIIYSKERLQQNGTIQLVIPKKKGLVSMQKMLLDIYGKFEVLGKGGGFWVLKATKT